jgi:hypothetical protein
MTILRDRVANATIDDWLDAILSAAEVTDRAAEGGAATL